MTRPAVSVVICTYTEARADLLRSALASVERQTLPPAETIVVVDHCAGLLARVKVEHPTTAVVANGGAPGLSDARNTGVRVARGEVVAFLDDDAEADREWLMRLADHYADPIVVGVGGAVDARWATARPTWFPDEFGWVVGCGYRGLPTASAPVRNLIGSNMSFRRALFDVIGGFRTDIGRIGTRPLGCEETELCIRARRALPGREILYDPAARVWQVVPPARARLRYFVDRCFSEGIAKARVARVAGAADALASERRHAFRTVPRAVAADLTGAVRRRERAGVGRAAASVVGLGVTGAGFFVGRVRLGTQRGVGRGLPGAVT